MRTPGILKGLAHLDDDGAGENTEPLNRVRSAVWGMFYADDAGVVSKSAEGLAKTMTVIVNVFEAAGLTVSEKKAESMPLRTTSQTPLTFPLVIEAAGKRYGQTVQSLYLGGLIDEIADFTPDFKRRVRLAWACFGRFKLELSFKETGSGIRRVRQLALGCESN